MRIYGIASGMDSSCRITWTAIRASSNSACFFPVARTPLKWRASEAVPTSTTSSSNSKSATCRLNWRYCQLSRVHTTRLPIPQLTPSASGSSFLRQAAISICNKPAGMTADATSPLQLPRRCATLPIFTVCSATTGCLHWRRITRAKALSAVPSSATRSSGYRRITGICHCLEKHAITCPNCWPFRK